MNIDRVDQNRASRAYGAPTRRAGEIGAGRSASDAPSAGGANGSAAGDGVELSAEGRLVARANAAVRAAPDVRVERVGALRERVQSGSYRVEDEALASSLIASDDGSSSGR